MKIQEAETGKMHCPRSSQPKANPLLGACCRILHALALTCRGAWSRGLGQRANGKEPLRVMSRLAVAPGITVSVIQFEADRFLVAASAKGEVTLLALPSLPAAGEKTSARNAAREKRTLIRRAAVRA